MVFETKTRNTFKPRLFSIEGADGVGKSTVISTLHSLSSKAFLKFKTPPDEIAGIRAVYDEPRVSLNTRFLYYFGSNLLVSDIIRSLLESTQVCVDRMILSTIVYHNILSGKQDAFTRFLELYETLGGLFPDVTVVLTAEREARVKRLMGRPSIQNTKHDLDLDLASRVQEEYLRLIDHVYYPSKSFVIDTTHMDAALVAGSILQIIGTQREEKIACIGAGAA